jgi:ketosteroid isomerase-like protein
MKSSFWIVMFLVAVSIGACAADCDKAIEGMRSSWLTAWNAKQLDEVMKLYAEDATLLTADGHLYVGRDKIGDHFKTLIGSVSDVSVKSAGVVCSTDTGYDTGTYSQKVLKGGSIMTGGTTMTGNTVMTGGATTTDKGNYSVTLRQESGKWQVVQHANVRSK